MNGYMVGLLPYLNIDLFDKYSFNMLENNYLYLATASSLDDTTECTSTICLNDIIGDDLAVFRKKVLSA